MVVFLNILPILIFAVGLYLSLKFKNWKILAAAVILEALLIFIQPSYLPKGEVKRSAIPDFEVSQTAIEDRQLKPKSGRDYDEKRIAEIKEGLPFIEAD